MGENIIRKNIRSIVLLAMIIAGIIVHAQDSTELYQKKINSFRKTKNIGVATLVVGVSAVALGSYWIYKANNQYEDDPWASFWGSLGGMALGIPVAFIGGVAVTGGTVMIIIGDKKMKQYQKKLGSLQVGMYLNHHGAGLTLTLRL